MYQVYASNLYGDCPTRESDVDGQAWLQLRVQDLTHNCTWNVAVHYWQDGQTSLGFLTRQHYMFNTLLRCSGPCYQSPFFIQVSSGYGYVTLGLATSIITSTIETETIAIRNMIRKMYKDSPFSTWIPVWEISIN